MQTNKYSMAIFMSQIQVQPFLDGSSFKGLVQLFSQVAFCMLRVPPFPWEVSLLCTVNLLLADRLLLIMVACPSIQFIFEVQTCIKDGTGTKNEVQSFGQGFLPICHKLTVSNIYNTAMVTNVHPLLVRFILS